MSWGVTGVALGAGTAIAGYFSAREQGAAQERANKANLALSREQAAESARQFDIGQETRGLDIERGAELSASRRGREDEINRMMQERFGALRGENLGRLAPYAEAGQQALTESQALLGLTGPEAEQAAISRITESPGQAFLRERQERSLLRNAAALGGLGGGNVRTGLQEQAFQRAQTDIDQRLSRLSALTGQGFAAARGGLESGFGPGYVQTGADIGVATETPTRPGTAPSPAAAPLPAATPYSSTSAPDVARDTRRTGNLWPTQGRTRAGIR